MRFGCNVALARSGSVAGLKKLRGFLTDLIDPRTSYPLLSRPEEIPHDDTALVKAFLGFPVIHNRCRVLEHPKWGTAVYPSTMMSSASPTITKSVLKRVAA